MTSLLQSKIKINISSHFSDDLDIFRYNSV